MNEKEMQEAFIEFLEEYKNEPNVPDYSGEYPQPYELTIEDAELILNAIKEKDQQITQLTNNWNELEEWLIDLSKPKINWQGDTERMYMLKIDYILDKMKEIKEKNNVSSRD